MRQKTVTISAVEAKIYPVDPFVHGNRVKVHGTYAGTYSVEWTNQDVLGGETPDWKAETAQSAQTGDSDLYYDGGITAFRFNVTAYTSGAINFTHSDQKGA